MGDAKFNQEFPSIDVYAPEGGPYTLLISGNGLPNAEARLLQAKAKSAGFSNETWLWQSNVSYFAEKTKAKP